MITFFGYSAPESDKEATKLLKTAWELNSGYKYFTTECIDIRSDGDLRDHWSDFYFSSHFVPFKKFEESYIGKYPRRSCEYMFLPTVEGKPLPQIHIPQFKELAEFRLWLAAIMDCE